MITVETLMAQDLELGISSTVKTHPGGGTLNGHQISLSTFATTGPAGVADTKTWNPGEIATSSYASTTITVAGALVGDFVLASFTGAGASALILGAQVSAADTVTVLLFNPTGAPVTPASGTLKVLVFKTR